MQLHATALLISAALLATPAAFAAGTADEQQCESKLEQLKTMRDSRDLEDAQDDQIERLKDQAEDYQDDERYQECVSTVDQALQQLGTTGAGTGMGTGTDQ
jgi:Spy/CpxP family protein refolding chaperone